MPTEMPGDRTELCNSGTRSAKPVTDLTYTQRKFRQYKTEQAQAKTNLTKDMNKVIPAIHI